MFYNFISKCVAESDTIKLDKTNSVRLMSHELYYKSSTEIEKSIIHHILSCFLITLFDQMLV